MSVLRLLPDGSCEEAYNGPGQPAWAGKPMPFAPIGANDPVPPGQYRLKIQRGKSGVNTGPLTLKAGQTRELRAILD